MAPSFLLLVKIRHGSKSSWGHRFMDWNRSYNVQNKPHSKPLNINNQVEQLLKASRHMLLMSGAERVMNLKNKGRHRDWRQEGDGDRFVTSSVHKSYITHCQYAHWMTQDFIFQTFLKVIQNIICASWNLEESVRNLDSLLSGLEF